MVWNSPLKVIKGLLICDHMSSCYVIPLNLMLYIKWFHYIKNASYRSDDLQHHVCHPELQFCCRLLVKHMYICICYIFLCYIHIMYPYEILNSPTNNDETLWLAHEIIMISTSTMSVVTWATWKTWLRLGSTNWLMDNILYKSLHLATQYEKALFWSLQCNYSLVNKHSYGKWSFIVDFPIKHSDFP